MIGIKVWIFKGEVLDQPEAEAAEAEAAQASARRRKPPRRAPRRAKQVTKNDAAEAEEVPQTIQGPDRGQRAARQHVAFGEYGLKATDRGRMTAREIEAARRAISRYVKRGGRSGSACFPDVPMTQKPLEVRMGNGKGNVEY